MNLTLEKPLAFFDLESTGVNVATDRIVEISILKVLPSGEKESLTKRVNPQVPIPIEASEVHGIYDFDVMNEPTFAELAKEIADFIGDADLAENVTIGAGTITCNHDGIGVNRTTIEEGAYIGSGCNLVAPLKVNANSTIASGSTITEDVDGDTLTIARSRQVKIKNWKGPKSRK